MPVYQYDVCFRALQEEVIQHIPVFISYHILYLALSCVKVNYRQWNISFIIMTCYTTM